MSADRLENETWDLLVIGGGIVGAGVARDAALRGLQVALVDQADFAFGTSSRSSRLLHGGIRYLAQGRVGLVREASREKMTLGRIAPHLCDPMRFTFPAYRGSGWPHWQLRLGVKIYDWLCGEGNFGASKNLSARAVLEAFPQLEPDGLNGAVQYFDGFTNDARLVLDTLRSADLHGAAVFNYVRVEHAEREGSVWRANLVDADTGRGFTTTARQIVNATGPWAGAWPQSRIKIRPTKGVHLVLHGDRFPLTDTLVIPAGERILFAIPWGDRRVLGTTDTDYDGPMDSPVCTPADRDYLLEMAEQRLPGLDLRRSDVLCAWAGLRPLIAAKGGDPSNLSRSHKILMSEPGWWDVAGGKLTTYRLIAEQAVDKIVRHAGFDARPCVTAREALLEAGAVKGVSGTLPPLVNRDTVEHYCRKEWARHLDDVMVRRTKWLYYLEDPVPAISQVGQWMAEFLNWDEARLAEEINRPGLRLQEIADSAA